MKNRVAHSTGSCTKVKENNRGKRLLLAKERLLTSQQKVIPGFSQG